MLEVLDERYCKCPFGAAGKEVGYPAPGTCLDYAYGKLNIRGLLHGDIVEFVANAFEIFHRFKVRFCCLTASGIGVPLDETSLCPSVLLCCGLDKACPLVTLAVVYRHIIARRYKR